MQKIFFRLHISKIFSIFAADLKKNNFNFLSKGLA